VLCPQVVSGVSPSETAYTVTDHVHTPFISAKIKNKDTTSSSTHTMTHTYTHNDTHTPSMSPQVMNGDSPPKALGVIAGVGRRALNSRGVPAKVEVTDTYYTHSYAESQVRDSSVCFQIVQLFKCTI